MKPTIDSQELTRRFNEDEAVWRTFDEARQAFAAALTFDSGFELARQAFFNTPDKPASLDEIKAHRRAVRSCPVPSTMSMYRTPPRFFISPLTFGMDETDGGALAAQPIVRASAGIQFRVMARMYRAVASP